MRGQHNSSSAKMLKLPFSRSHFPHVLAPPQSSVHRQGDQVQKTGRERRDLRFRPGPAPEGVLPPARLWPPHMKNEKVGLEDPRAS